MILLVLLSTGWGRINETEEEANRRYGEPLPTTEPERLVMPPVTKSQTYKKDDYLITVFFAPSHNLADKDPSDKICWLTYRREPLKRLEMIEVQRFLQANEEEGNKWIPDGMGGYIRKDGKAYAKIGTFPYQGADVPVSVSIFSLSIFQKNGALRPDANPKIPSGVNESTLKEL